MSETKTERMQKYMRIIKKDRKVVVIRTVSHMFKKLEEILNRLRDIKDIKKKIQIKLLEIKIYDA